MRGSGPKGKVNKSFEDKESIFTLRKVKHWERSPREVTNSLSLEGAQNLTLSNLIEL